VGGGAQRHRARDQSGGSARTLVQDTAGILDLPPGFSYRVLSRRGEPMSDGYRVPGNFDAMGVFEVNGGLVLMRNHEVSPGDSGAGPYGPGTSAPPEAYDREAYGGVTRVMLDRQGGVQSQQLALCGTHWNCAGGLSPWGWLSCEEIFIPKHGYVFLCPAEPGKLLPARRIREYGRFRHEAASVDPATNIAYLSEDREDAAFYRFVPDHPDLPFRGRLQGLRVRGARGFDTSRMAIGESRRIDWVDVPEPDPVDDNVRYQARERGAAKFARTEGLWLAGEALYMCATTGGPIGRGQIFKLQHAGPEPHLTLLTQTTDPSVLDMPDNITVAPNGDLYVAEDGLEGNFIRRITAHGQVVDFARNAATASEFAGPCFAPDGKTLFVNIQREGLTIAIRGPFANEPAVAARHARNASVLSTQPGMAGIGTGIAVLALAALARRKRAATGG
jgi:secreted PhoX family phosphatase